tara:strand:- start:22997 stop:23968 length:972 start_codon:yes stop_codon:yes gene_type:complete
MSVPIEESKILVTGGTGMVGYALKWGYVYGNGIPNAIFISSKDYDLRDSDQVEAMFRKHNPEYVIHLAARVGGIKANSDNAADFFYDNIMINTNVLHAAKNHGVKKLISLLSTCIYPNKISYPLQEKSIHDGEPHESNFAYAYAKRMLDVQSRAYRKQYGCNFITVVLNNLFGENDNFHYEDSHVIPAMIRKIYEAKGNNEAITLWGDGSPLREFTYSGDLAEILLFLLKNYDGSTPLNVGQTKEYSIRDVAHLICGIANYDSSNIIWDTEKPTGQLRKPSDNALLMELGWRNNSYTQFEIALQKTCDWFVKNYPNIRGVENK